MKKIRKIASEVCRITSAVCMAGGVALLTMATYLSFCEVVK